MHRIILMLALTCAVQQTVTIASAATVERRPITQPKPEPDHGPTLPPDPWYPI